MSPKVNPITIRLGKHSTLLWGRQPTAFFFNFNSTKFSFLLVKFLLHVFYKKKIQLIDFVFNQSKAINSLFLLVYKLLFKKKRYYTPPGSFFSFFFFYLKKNRRHIHAKRRKFLKVKFVFNYYMYESLIPQRYRFNNKPSKSIFLNKSFNTYYNKGAAFLPLVRSKRLYPKVLPNINLFYKKKKLSLLTKKRGRFFLRRYRKQYNNYRLLFYFFRLFFRKDLRKKKTFNFSTNHARYLKNKSMQANKFFLYFFLRTKPMDSLWFLLKKKLPFFFKKVDSSLILKKITSSKSRIRYQLYYRYRKRKQRYGIRSTFEKRWRLSNFKILLLGLKNSCFLKRNYNICKKRRRGFKNFFYLHFKRKLFYFLLIRFNFNIISKDTFFINFVIFNKNSLHSQQQHLIKVSSLFYKMFFAASRPKGYLFQKISLVSFFFLNLLRRHFFNGLQPQQYNNIFFKVFLNKFLRFLLKKNYILNNCYRFQHSVIPKLSITYLSSLRLIHFVALYKLMIKLNPSLIGFLGRRFAVSNKRYYKVLFNKLRFNLLRLKRNKKKKKKSASVLVNYKPLPTIYFLRNIVPKRRSFFYFNSYFHSRFFLKSNQAFDSSLLKEYYSSFSILNFVLNYHISNNVTKFFFINKTLNYFKYTEIINLFFSNSRFFFFFYNKFKPLRRYYWWQWRYRSFVKRRIQLFNRSNLFYIKKQQILLFELFLSRVLGKAFSVEIRTPISLFRNIIWWDLSMCINKIFMRAYIHRRAFHFCHNFINILYFSVKFYTLTGLITFFCNEFYYRRRQKFFLNAVERILKFWKTDALYYFGFSMLISGKLKRRPRARKFILKRGEKPRLGLLGLKLQYCSKQVMSSFGVYGVKMWLYYI